MLTLSSPDTDPKYTYDGTDLTLKLTDWCYITNAQVVITGLSGNPEDWYLSVKSGSGTSHPWQSIQDFRINSAGVTSGSTSSYSKVTRGTKNADGVAFYLRVKSSTLYNLDAAYDAATHTFELGNATNSYQFKKEKTPLKSSYATANPSATDKEKLDHTFTAIKIGFSSFSAI